MSSIYIDVHTGILLSRGFWERTAKLFFVDKFDIILIPLLLLMLILILQ